MDIIRRVLIRSLFMLEEIFGQTIAETPFPHIWGPFHVPHPSARSALRISSRSSSVTSSRSRRAALIRGR